MAKKARKVRQALSKHKAALASPPLTTFIIPATALFALVRPIGGAATGAAMTIAGPSARTIGAPALATGERHMIGKLERGSVVSLNAAFDLYINTGLGTYKRVARGA